MRKALRRSVRVTQIERSEKIMYNERKQREKTKIARPKRKQLEKNKTHKRIFVEFVGILKSL